MSEEKNDSYIPLLSHEHPVIISAQEANERVTMLYNEQVKVQRALVWNSVERLTPEKMNEELNAHIESGDKWFTYLHNIHQLPSKFADVQDLNPALCMDSINQLPALQQLVRAGYRVRYIFVPYPHCRSFSNRLDNQVPTGIMICVTLSDCSLHSTQCEICGYQFHGCGGNYTEIVDTSKQDTSSSSHCIIV